MKRCIIWLCVMFSLLIISSCGGGDSNDPMIVNSSVPDAVAGSRYLANLQATPRTGLRWSVISGTLPDGLYFSWGQAPYTSEPYATISGYPTTPGTSVFTVAAYDFTGKVATRDFSITVTAPTTGPIISTASTLPDATTGIAYNMPLSVSGGTGAYSWRLSGDLPEGLTLDSSTGIISGVPVGWSSGGTPPGEIRTSNFTITVTDSATPTAGTYTIRFTLTAISRSGPLAIATTSPLPTANLNYRYGTTLFATGGTYGYSWAVTDGTLPDGLALGTSGFLGGVPTATGTWNFTVTVTDAAQPTAGTASIPLSLTVIEPQPVKITTTSPLRSAYVNSPYFTTIAATDGIPWYTWSVTAGTLPNGLVFNPYDSSIFGTPTTAGTWNFTITVSDQSQPTATTASVPFSLTVLP